MAASRKEAVPDCRLYLQIPQSFSLGVEKALTEVLAELDIASILLAGDPKETSPESVLRLRDLAVAREAAFLLYGDVEMAERIGADGVHLSPDPEYFRLAREALGQRSVVGAGPLASRHLAMVLAELGADYVAFGAPLGNENGGGESAELIAWWSEIFVVPCVAWDIASPEAAGRLAMLGADFIAPPASIWTGADPVKEILAIDQALQAGSKA